MVQRRQLLSLAFSGPNGGSLAHPNKCFDTVTSAGINILWNFCWAMNMVHKYSRHNATPLNGAFLFFRKVFLKPVRHLPYKLSFPWAVFTTS